MRKIKRTTQKILVLFVIVNLITSSFYPVLLYAQDFEASQVYTDDFGTATPEDPLLAQTPGMADENDINKDFDAVRPVIEDDKTQEEALQAYDDLAGKMAENTKLGSTAERVEEEKKAPERSYTLANEILERGGSVREVNPADQAGRLWNGFTSAISGIGAVIKNAFVPDEETRRAKELGERIKADLEQEVGNQGKQAQQKRLNQFIIALLSVSPEEKAKIAQGMGIGTEASDAELLERFREDKKLGVEGDPVGGNFAIVKKTGGYTAGYFYESPGYSEWSKKEAIKGLEKTGEVVRDLATLGFYSAVTRFPEVRDEFLPKIIEACSSTVDTNSNGFKIVVGEYQGSQRDERCDPNLPDITGFCAPGVTASEKEEAKAAAAQIKANQGCYDAFTDYTELMADAYAGVTGAVLNVAVDPIVVVGATVKVINVTRRGAGAAMRLAGRSVRVSEGTKIIHPSEIISAPISRERAPVAGVKPPEIREVPFTPVEEGAGTVRRFEPSDVADSIAPSAGDRAAEAIRGAEQVPGKTAEELYQREIEEAIQDGVRPLAQIETGRVAREAADEAVALTEKKGAEEAAAEAAAGAVGEAIAKIGGQELVPANPVSRAVALVQDALDGLFGRRAGQEAAGLTRGEARAAIEEAGSRARQLVNEGRPVEEAVAEAVDGNLSKALGEIVDGEARDAGEKAARAIAEQGADVAARVAREETEEAVAEVGGRLVGLSPVSEAAEEAANPIVQAGRDAYDNTLGRVFGRSRPGEEAATQVAKKADDLVEAEIGRAEGLVTREAAGGAVEGVREDTVRAIADSKNLDELIIAVRNSGGIQGSGRLYQPDELVELIEGARSTRYALKEITRTAGLRDKVTDLFWEEVLAARKEMFGKAAPQAVEKQTVFQKAADAVIPEPVRKAFARELPIVNSPKQTGRAALSDFARQNFKFLDLPEYRVTFGNGKTYTISDKYVVEAERVIIPMRAEDGSVLMAYLSTSEGSFKYYVGTAATQFPDRLEPRWFIKHSLGKDYEDLPFFLDARIKELMGSGKSEQLRTQRAVEDILDYDFNLRHADAQRGMRAMENLVEEEGVYGVNARNRPHLLDVDYSRPINIAYNKGQGRLDVYFEGPASVARYTFIVNPKTGVERVSIPDTTPFDGVRLFEQGKQVRIDFRFRPKADPMAAYTGLPVLVRTGKGILLEPGWENLARDGMISPIGQELARLTNGFTRSLPDEEIENLVSRFQKSVAQPQKEAGLAMTAGAALKNPDRPIFRGIALATDQTAESRVVRLGREKEEIVLRHKEAIEQLKEDPELKSLLLGDDKQAKEFVRSKLGAIIADESSSDIEFIIEDLTSDILISQSVGSRAREYVLRNSGSVPLANRADLPDIKIREVREVPAPQGTLEVRFSQEEISSLGQRVSEVANYVVVPEDGVFNEIGDIVGSLSIKSAPLDTQVGADQRKLVNLLHLAAYPDSYYKKGVQEFLQGGGRAEDLPSLFADLLADQKARLKRYGEAFDSVVDEYNQKVLPKANEMAQRYGIELPKLDSENIAWLTEKEVNFSCRGVCTIQTELGGPSGQFFGIAFSPNQVLGKDPHELAELRHALLHESIHANVLHKLGIQAAISPDPVTISFLEELTENLAIFIEKEAIGKPGDIKYGYGAARSIGRAFRDILLIPDNTYRVFAFNQDPAGYIKYLDNRLNTLSEEGYKTFITGLYRRIQIGPAQKELLLGKRARSIADIREIALMWKEKFGQGEGFFDLEHLKKYPLNTMFSFGIPEEKLAGPDTAARFFEDKFSMTRRPGYLPSRYYSETSEGVRVLQFERDPRVEEALREALQEIQTQSSARKTGKIGTGSNILAIFNSIAWATSDNLPQDLFFDQSLLESLVKQKLIQRGFDISVAQNIDVFSPIFSWLPTGYRFVTGRSGSNSGFMESGRYKVEVQSMPGFNLSVPVSVEVKDDSTIVVPIGIREGSGKVERKGYAQETGTDKDKETGKVTVVVFADKNKNGKLDKNEDILPWAGLTVELKRVSSDRAISLSEGDNQVTLQILPDKLLTASILLRDIALQEGDAISVSTWENGAWKTYVAEGAKAYSFEDFPILPEKSYSIKSRRDSIFLLKGQEFVAPN